MCFILWFLHLHYFYEFLKLFQVTHFKLWWMC